MPDTDERTYTGAEKRMSERFIAIGDVQIPLDSFAISGTALLGIKESGKTVAAKGIAEQLLDYGIPIVVFDAIGVWRHLKRAGDGPGAKAYSVVVGGGAEPDLQLTPQTAEQIVRAAIKENIPLVIDLYDKHLSKADWRKIVQKCFRVLLYENEGLRHVFLEETAEYAPQKVLDGETYSEVEKFVRMGGNKSLGITLINQRAQEVNKAILDLCENVILLRQRGANAIKNLEKWTELLSPDSSKRIASEMPNLGAGECWVFTSESEGASKTRTRMCRSFHPDRRKPESVHGRMMASTSAFVERMEADLSQLIEHQKSNDPKELKKRIAELERQLAAMNPVPDQKAIESAVAPFIRRIDLLDAWLGDLVLEITESACELDNLRKRIIAHANKIQFIKKQFAKSPREATEGEEPPASIGRIEGAAVSKTNPAWGEKVEGISAVEPKGIDIQTQRVRRSAGVSESGPNPKQRQPLDSPLTISNDSELGKGERAILTVLAQYPHGKNRRSLGTLSGYSSRGGSFGTYLSRLRTKGLIDGSDPILITEMGKAALGEFEELPRGVALQEYWKAKLGKGPRKLLEVLIEAYPNALTKQELGERSGYEPSGGSFGTYLSRLRTKELIHPTRLIASEAFFE